MPPPESHAVTLAVNDSEAESAAIAATSILANSPSLFHFYLLDLGLQPATREWLAKVIGIERTTFVPADPAWHGRDDAGLLLPPLLAGTADQVVHLGCRTLVVDDLAPVYAVTMGRFAVAAVPVARHWNAATDHHSCLDAGVLRIDTRPFVELALAGRLAGNRRDPEHQGPDGHLLCVALEDQWRELDPRWNCATSREALEAHEGGLPVVYNLALGHDTAGSFAVAYQEYRRLTVRAGGPPRRDG